ncbi:surface lipoprotein assembly modifier [Mannheimia indoligenes]|uniref:surface lipoprotein assembly modifier n=1 Tax=Mannheimia indoligenes TaxID=3103145 RepID=UPI002FE68927
MKKYTLLFPLFSPFVLAETVIEQNTDPVSFERHSQAVKFEQNFAKKPQKTTAYQPKYSLNQNVEQQINQAILSQNWENLAPLLSRYQQMPNVDPLLWHYAQAALAYAKKDHHSAIFHYRQLLARNPNLVYPRFDLALVLAEDQQFREAEREFSRIQANLSPDLGKIAANTQMQIAENERWQPDFYLQYTQTNNVNNASSSPIVSVNGRIFRKNEENLPQSAKGVRYGFGLSKLQNLRGNHFVGLGLNYNGIYYWDNQDYREQSLSISPSYSYRTARYRLSFSPFIEQNWLGSSRYNYQFGATVSGLRYLNSQWLMSGSFTHLQKRYFDELTASRYNSYQHQISGGLQWQAVKNWRFFANLDGSREIAREKAQTSNKWLARVGVIYQGEKWATQASLGFGKRYFADKHYLFGYKRQDKEYQVNLAVWNRTWHWQGIVPKLNFRYQKMDSNIADFYSRQNKELFFTLEKLF